MRKTFVALARQGTSSFGPNVLSQSDAAKRLQLKRATLNNYEKGQRMPSELKTWDLLNRLALGMFIPDARPLLLVGFSLFGNRLVSRRGELLCFKEIPDARRLADELDACSLEQVVVVPAWPSFVEEMVERERAATGRGGAVMFDDRHLSLDVIVTEVLEELSVQAVSWMRESLAGRPQRAARLGAEDAAA
jgi:transcriptional regulator with XRE-family HTH domain